jgi:hypothetical protein
LKIKRLQGNGCKNCGATLQINLKRHQKKSCVVAVDKGVRCYLASLIGEANNINDEIVAAGNQIYLQSLAAAEPMEIDQFKNDQFDMAQEKPDTQLKNFM